MKYTYEFYRDGLGGLRIRLPKRNFYNFPFLGRYFR